MRPSFDPKIRSQPVPDHAGGRCPPSGVLLAATLDGPSNVSTPHRCRTSSERPVPRPMDSLRGCTDTATTLRRRGRWGCVQRRELLDAAVAALESKTVTGLRKHNSIKWAPFQPDENWGWSCARLRAYHHGVSTEDWERDWVWLSGEPNFGSAKILHMSRSVPRWYSRRDCRLTRFDGQQM
ncbi:hypothetical protein P280DRAFT_5002 [Massarina eburnea CBS 473.64]|uniref:Uncharacterized protein n=1 Tax=Massarina eburnea CBS 473.64 TaxID=1395130 RepID=A0A6A6SE94_9PLEO|nr:hypothetical protein P280DRAFT_5002 [Massarina eburnea CBS 473.64]